MMGAGKGEIPGEHNIRGILGSFSGEHLRSKSDV